jgi:probable HAF family extracellular repeat protein
MAFLVSTISATVAFADPLDTWHTRTVPTQGVDLNGCAFGNGLFVVVGNGGTILTSPDGVSWTARSSGTTKHLYGIAYGNGRFVAGGGSTKAYTSLDGETWNEHGLALFTLKDISYGNGTFVAVGTSGDIYSSPDGETWTEQDSGTGRNLNGIAYGNGLFVAAGENFAADSIICRSPDGDIWTTGYSGTTADLTGIGFGHGLFVVVGYDGAIRTSDNGQGWTARNSGTENLLRDIAFGNGFFVAIGSGGTVLTSPDGSTWSPRSSPTTNELRGIAYGNGTFVVVGQTDTVLQSEPFTTGPSSLAGVVTSGGIGLQGVTMTLSMAGAAAGSTATAPDGSYAFAALPDGTYTITPGMAGATFTPPSMTLQLADSNRTGLDFSRVITTISGRVTSNGSGLQGVTVTLSKAGSADKITASDADGNFTFASLPDGTYTITPTMAGLSFVPPYRTVPLVGINLTGQDFSRAIATLAVNFTPPAGGTVTGEGISCPGDCTENFVSVQDVILTATANAGYNFGSWTGDCTLVSENRCTVSTGNDRSVTANFNVDVCWDAECDDGNPCTVDACDAINGCTHQPSCGIWTIKDLGTLGGSSSKAFAVNNSGQVAGESDTRDPTSRHPFLYGGGIMKDINPSSPQYYGHAYAINDSGEVAGDYSYYDQGAKIRAFLYSGGSSTNLGTLGGGLSYAYDLNNSGQVAGISSTSDNHTHGFLYSGGAMIDIGTLGGAHSYAYGINDSGQVVGQSYTSDLNKRAFLYSNGQMTDLGTLGGGDSCASAINNSGQVVGYADTGSSSSHAFLYSGGTMTDLGALGSSSKATAINNSGQIVGSCATSSMQRHAFLYRNGQMIDLNNLVTPSSPPSSGWVLLSAEGINDHGQIVGYGTINGITHAFLLSPEPDSYLLTLTVVSDTPERGGGSVQSDAGGVLCNGSGSAASGMSGVCQATFPPGTIVTLYQDPDSNSTRANWSLPGCLMEQSCQVTMDGDKSVAATFAYAYMAKVDSSGNRFDTLNEALANTSANDSIFAREVSFIENLTLAAERAITLTGGLTTAYTSQDAWTTLKGVLTVQSGSLTVNRLIVR